MRTIEPIDIADIERARDRIAAVAIRTPLIPLELPDGERRIWLKLESLQPIGSFKIRGAANAMACADPAALDRGVYTGSAGNMAQGVAYAARLRGIPCRVVVPDTAPRTKLEAIARLGATVVPVPFDEWWSVIRDHGHPDEKGFFIHPVSDPAVIAGNGTVGLEILEDLPDVAAVVVPYGGGGLACGIACALRAPRPGVKVYAAEVETAAPFAASLDANGPVDVERIASFVDGIGGRGVLPEMWPLASSRLSGSLVMTLEEVCDALRLLAARAHVIAEGAGACAVAAAWAATRSGEGGSVGEGEGGSAGGGEGGSVGEGEGGSVGDGEIVAVVSGGNIDTAVLLRILAGEVP
jgi:threonine dehydratase